MYINVIIGTPESVLIRERCPSLRRLWCQLCFFVFSESDLLISENGILSETDIPDSSYEDIKSK